MTQKMDFEKAIIVGVNLNARVDFEDSMEELENLAEACNIRVVARIDQNLRRAQPQFYVGSGKVDDVRIAIEAFDADLVVFNHELTPSQLRNLEKALNCRVVDRTNLILEIFEKRAKTREAKLQVEAAHLQYLLPRLIGSYESLGRQSGGVGTKNKGVGEKKLELDRRKVEQKIHELNREI
jgi:GTP-binding protein HflX